jgi:hypothetical protein
LHDRAVQLPAHGHAWRYHADRRSITQADFTGHGGAEQCGKWNDCDYFAAIPKRNVSGEQRNHAAFYASYFMAGTDIWGRHGGSQVMQQIVLQSVPSQQTQVVLDAQSCSISVYVKNQCMFFDLAVNGTQIAYGVQCKNLVSLVSTSYLGFSGWMVFFDTQGTDDPVYTGLGTRWVLLYLDSADLEAFNGIGS